MQRQYIALGGLAMLLVVLNHAIHVGLQSLARLGYAPITGGERFALTALQAFGAFAVPIFLFVSGSFMAYAARSAPLLSPTFVWKSVRHIIWPYVLWSLVFYLMVFVFAGERYSPAGYVKNLLVGYPFHFVPLLITFYVLSPVLVPLARRHAWPLLIGIGLFQLLLLNVRDPGLLGFAFPRLMDRLFPLVLGNPLADWAIYFPMGLVFGLHASAWKTRLRHYRWLFAALAALLFAAGLLDAARVVQMSWARFFCPVPLMFLLPIVERKSLPLVTRLEQVGKHSYGLYLTHLIVMNLVVFTLELINIQMAALPLLLFPLLLVAGLFVPLLLMNNMQLGPTRKVYRYVFG